MMHVAAAALLGLLVGPFLRRLVDQVPERRPLFEPDASELVPIRSWFTPEPAGTRSFVGSPDDRTADTDTRVRRWRAPATDIGAAVVLAVFAARLGWSPDLPAFLVFGASLVVVTVIDIDHFRIPDRIVFPTFGASAALLAVASAAVGEWGGLIAALAGAGAYFAFLFVFFFVYPRGMGFGDVKLALVLGLHLGWAGAMVEVDGELVYRGLEYGLPLVLYGALIGSMLGAVVGISLLVVQGRKTFFPFGPSLCLGAMAAIVVSEQILN
jgi:leader peptidase (prepilin peptidase) / N-methyltransferase